MDTIYRMHCIECGEFLKNIRAKEKIQLECSKCGWNFSMSSTNEKVPDTNGFDIQITIPVTVKVSGDWPIEPEKRVMSVNEDEIQYLSLHCIFCKQTPDQDQRRNPMQWRQKKLKPA